jgi:hypothetical protein
MTDHRNFLQNSIRNYQKVSQEANLLAKKRKSEYYSSTDRVKADWAGFVMSSAEQFLASS